MSIVTPDSIHAFASALAYRAAAGADAAEIAAAIAAAWQHIETVLSPVIGQPAVAALYRRCLYLTGRVYPWLTSGPENFQTAMDPAALRAVLAQQSSADASTAGSAHLQAFHTMLAGLIGHSLTARLLHSAWGNPPPDPLAQETSP